MEQIVDLQNDPDFQEMDVAFLSIATDPADQQAPAAEELGIQVPMLVDAGAEVSAAYNVLQWAVPTGEPGHTFVLVDEQGQVAWIKDYGAPDNPDRTMYVPLEELKQEIRTNLSR